MTIYTCRDFSIPSSAEPADLLYYSAIFLHKVMNFTIVGNTSINLTGSALSIASGSSGSLNLGTDEEYYFSGNLGTYVPSSNDIGRILTLRSENNPRVNSGLFSITSVNIPSGALVLDYRSGDIPPPESETLQWALWESGSASSWPNGGNSSGSSGYNGYGPTATTTRIILQSPHSSSWQVRLCYETVQDQNTNQTTGTKFSIAPGFNGNSIGDFLTRDNVNHKHLHSILWFNTGDSNYRGGVVGFDGGNKAKARRIYMWGEQDLTPGSFIFASRSPVEGADDSHAWAAFGFCEEEVEPLPSESIQRLFVMGNMFHGNSGKSNISWRTDGEDEDELGIVGYGMVDQPIIGGLGIYTLARADSGASGHIIESANAKDSEYVNATELLPVDVNIGVTSKGFGVFAQPRYQFEFRTLGRFPLARMGRTNFSDFTTTTDTNKSWLHLANGAYLPWSGSVTP